MSELRYDPLAGHWVNIAAIRAERPNEFQRHEFRRPESICPFCAGKETLTPPAVLELSDASEPAEKKSSDATWVVRVVPNKFPAFDGDDGAPPQPTGPYARAAATGSHEIIIESPRHVASVSQLRDRELLLSWRAYQLRVAESLRLEPVRQVILFKNCRPESGASLEHVHSQLIGSPILTDAQNARWERCAAAHAESGKSLLTALVEFEADGCRQIASRGSFVAFCPFASRFAYQIRIAPQGAAAPFEAQDAEALGDCAMLVREMIGRLESALSDPPYNFILHLPPKLPPQSRAPEIFPWFIEIIPRLGRWAGWELADGGWINDCAPEIAARVLRGEAAAAAREDGSA